MTGYSISVRWVLYLAWEVLKVDFGHIGDGPQTLTLRTLPLIDGLFTDRVPQLLSPLRALLYFLLETGRHSETWK